MIKTPVTMQELRKKIYVKAKAEPQWRFWGKVYQKQMEQGSENKKSQTESQALEESHINLNKKHAGKPYAGKPHVRFEEAGTGDRTDDRLKVGTHLKGEKQKRSLHDLYCYYACP